MSHQPTSGAERAGRDAMISAIGAIIVAVACIFLFAGLNQGHTNPDLAGNNPMTSSFSH
jgi:hypothetical protein